MYTVQRLFRTIVSEKTRKDEEYKKHSQEGPILKARSWRGVEERFPYCSTCSSLFRRPTWRDHHWRHQHLETLHHSNNGVNPIDKKNGLDKKRGEVSKKRGECRQKEEGKKSSKKKKWSWKGGGGVYVLYSMLTILSTCHLEISPLNKRASPNTTTHRNTEKSSEKNGCGKKELGGRQKTEKRLYVLYTMCVTFTASHVERSPLNALAW